MKKLILFLVPFALWGQTLFVLFDAGETLALTPVIERLKEKGEEVLVLKYDPKTMDRFERLPEEEVASYAPDVLVVGDASQAQLQFVQALKGKAEIFCYYDNPLEIDRIPYAELIRTFEKKVDHFLVPSRCAAQSSSAKNPTVVGNPDLDFFEAEVENYPITPGRVVYIGGYDIDYEEAFKHFVKKFQAYEGEVVVRPHPKTDGSLEKRLTEGTLIQVGESLSTVESLGRAELVVIHRSSLGTKASLCGKKVLSIESNGEAVELSYSRESLGVPHGAVALIEDLLQQKSSK